MIRVSVMYPNEPGRRFEWGHYMKHVAEATERLVGLGLVRLEVDKGIGTAAPGAPPPFVAMTHMYFNTPEDEQRCRAHAAELMADIPNYTDIQYEVQVSEVL